MRGGKPGNRSAGKAEAKAGGQERAWAGGGCVWSVGHEVGRPEVRLLYTQSSHSLDSQSAYCVQDTGLLCGLSHLILETGYEVGTVTISSC